MGIVVVTGEISVVAGSTAQVVRVVGTAIEGIAGVIVITAGSTGGVAVVSRFRACTGAGEGVSFSVCVRETGMFIGEL